MTCGDTSRVRAGFFFFFITTKIPIKICMDLIKKNKTLDL